MFDIYNLDEMYIIWKEKFSDNIKRIKVFRNVIVNLSSYQKLNRFNDIDKAILQAYTYKDFETLLKNMGYEVEFIKTGTEGSEQLNQVYALIKETEKKTRTTKKTTTKRKTTAKKAKTKK